MTLRCCSCKQVVDNAAGICACVGQERFHFSSPPTMRERNVFTPNEHEVPIESPGEEYPCPQESSPARLKRSLTMDTPAVFVPQVPRHSER